MRAEGFSIDIRIRRGRRTIECAFTAGPGLTALFGPSGAGKTSVLDAIAGLVRPEEGHIRAAGQTLFDSEGKINLPPEQRGCGYVFQDLRLFPHRNVRDNLLFGRRLAAPGQRLGLEEATGFLGITHLMDRMPRTLSGGEAQRVAIGRALLSGPRFLLMDEPLAAVDAARRADILAVVKGLRDHVALPILYVSHDRAEVERIADTIVPLG